MKAFGYWFGWVAWSVGFCCFGVYINSTNLKDAGLCLLSMAVAGFCFWRCG